MAITLLIFKQFSVKNIHCQVVWQHMQGVMGVLMTFLLQIYGLQCFDTVRWAAGRASGL